MSSMLQTRLDNASSEMRNVADELSGAKEEIMNLNSKLDEQVKLKGILEKQFTEVKSELLNKEKLLKNFDESSRSSDTTIHQLRNEKANLLEEISSLKERLV